MMRNVPRRRSSVILLDLCRELNRRNASYIVVGGMTMNIHGFARNTLWKTKQTFREKDEIDRSFLRKLLEDRGEWPVE